MFEGSDKSSFNSSSNEGTGASPYEGRESMWDSAGGKVQIFLDVVLVILTAFNLYWAVSTRTRFEETTRTQADQYKLLSHRLDSNDDQLARLGGEMKVTGEKLGLTTEELARAKSLTASMRKQQQNTVKQLNDAIAQKASSEDLSRMQSEADQKFSGLSGDLAKTNEALTGAKGELSGAIARTHDELVALAHKSDRDFYEFAVPRKGAKQKVGGVTIELDKADTKRNKFTVYLYFDDKRVQLKDRGLMEPVHFYVSGAPSPVELVVNKLGKSTIAGYLSTPRGLYAGVPNVLTERPGA
ncbi:MAG: hypothetical protein ACE145_11185 [Terriglobia bacterium]